MEKKKVMRGSYVDGSYVPTQEDPIIIKRIPVPKHPVNENKDNK